ncbi:hypothetical protein Pcinc_026976 [Petrolisthes cinctipes]|uniref:Endonuclease/exonuclease/phosphatase family domain-containing protein 1 n=1 Tax=Petrolisthes cinctipes TaxID=88211 RepID=A0AAE1F6D5_PETCI|nr:hypothetical protein Pcinc_026976 [Petrolisthes cinctipes]
MEGGVRGGGGVNREFLRLISLPPVLERSQLSTTCTQNQGWQSYEGKWVALRSRMGQCTSGELPPPPSDAVDSHRENGKASPSPPVSTSDTTTASSSTSTPNHPKSFSRRHRSSISTNSWVNRLSRRRKNKDLSATFNLIDFDGKTNYLNINTAAEEELMTLDGVTRSMAHSIVEYRAAIGGFRRVEDLALVSGVGAARLQRFRADVVVGDARRKSSSQSSSRTQSVDSLPSCESGKSHRSQPLPRPSPPPRTLNVNHASIFELMAVRGMTQEMAANIVEYRERKGPFRTMEELVKVRGVSSRVLSLLKVYLSVNSPIPSPYSAPSDVISITSYTRYPYTQRAFQSKNHGHRRTYSAPLNEECSSRLPLDNSESMSPRVSIDFTADIFELLSLRSERPIVGSVFSGRYQGRPAFRIATWNLQCLTCEKISNLGVLEVVCRTVLENGFSVLALQEVASRDVLEKICSELNQGTLRRVREWGGPRGEWRWQVSDEPAGRIAQGTEYAAFIYNGEHGLQMLSSSLLSVHNNNHHHHHHHHHPARKPFLGYFKCFDYEFVVVSLHIDALDSGKKKRKASTSKDINRREETRVEGNGTREMTKTNPCQLTPLVTALKQKLINEKNIILLGDFNMSSDNAAFDVLRDSSYSSIVVADTKGDAGKSDNSVGDSGSDAVTCYDNIWLNPHIRAAYTGHWGMVREGLHHMAIPCGWGWGGAVSDHPPVYCDLCPDLPPPSTSSTTTTPAAPLVSVASSSSSSNFPRRLSKEVQQQHCEGDVEK